MCVFFSYCLLLLKELDSIPYEPNVVCNVSPLMHHRGARPYPYSRSFNTNLQVIEARSQIPPSSPLEVDRNLDNHFCSSSYEIDKHFVKGRLLSTCRDHKLIPNNSFYIPRGINPRINNSMIGL